MSLLGKTARMRLMAIVLCLLALSVYISFAPTRSNASGCSCSGGGGSCSGRNECRCLFEGQACIRCEIVPNSANCNVAPVVEGEN